MLNHWKIENWNWSGTYVMRIERNLPDSGKLSRGAAICPAPVLTLSSNLFEPMDFQLSNSSSW